MTSQLLERSEHCAVVERGDAGAAKRGDTLRLGEVLGALSYALDITEGQPCGHSARSCLVGMHLAEKLHFSSADRSALFYALLLKDARWVTKDGKLVNGKTVEPFRIEFLGSDPIDERVARSTTAANRSERSLRLLISGVFQKTHRLRALFPSAPSLFH